MSAKPLIIPSIFTAKDKFSPTLLRMQDNLGSFAAKADALSARSDRAFRKLTPGLSSASKQLVQMAGAAAAIGGAFMLGRSSIQSIMDYEDAVQSFRTIVSDLTDVEFSKFEGAIASVAKKTSSSSTEVAKSFEKIAGLNADFAKTADGLSAVSSAAITLSKASRDDLATSAENLVGILNQFSMGAKESTRVIDALAAGQAVGASSITETAQAFQVFGAVAKQSNVSLEQSIALTEVLASKQIKSAEAGTALRGTFIRLKASGLGYKSGLFNVRDALEEVNSKYKKLHTAKEKDALLDKVFGTINMTTGSILMNNIGLYDKYSLAVKAKGGAEQQAAINSDTLSKTIERLQNKWATLITTSKGSHDVLKKVKSIISFLTDNMETIISTTITVVKWFAIWKGVTLGLRAATMAANIAMGIQGALMGIANIAIGKSAVALGAYNIATKAVTAAQWLLNAAMDANPIGIVILAIGALIGAMTYLASKYSGWGEQWDIAITGMGYSFDGFVYSIKGQWGILVNAFETSIDHMKIAWFSLQHAMGNMSDAGYSAEKTKMDRQQKERRNYIKENQALASMSYMNAAQYTNNVLTRKNSNDDMGADEAVNSSKRQSKLKELYASYSNKLISSQPGVAEAMQKANDYKENPTHFVSTKVAQANAQNINTTNTKEANATITIKNDANSPVTVDGFTKNFDIMPQMTSTMSTKK